MNTVTKKAILLDAPVDPKATPSIASVKSEKEGVSGIAIDVPFVITGDNLIAGGTGGRVKMHYKNGADDRAVFYTPSSLSNTSCRVTDWPQPPDRTSVLVRFSFIAANGKESNALTLRLVT